MYSNFHTHTYLCGHAVGEPFEYVENAIKNHIEILGFSDHVPYPFPNGYISEVRMRMEQTESYINMILNLREKYRGKIKIYIGYEAEYYPQLFKNMLENIQKFECDYLILGQHFLENEYEHSIYSGNVYNNKDLMIKYIDQVIDAIKTEKFTYIAHPDLMAFRDDDVFYMEQAERLCICAKKLSVPLEINMLGLTDHRAYPYDKFWEVARQVGNDVIIGCDAHSPEAVGNPESVKLAEDYASKFGFKPIQLPEFKKV